MVVIPQASGVGGLFCGCVVVGGSLLFFSAFLFNFVRF